MKILESENFKKSINKVVDMPKLYRKSYYFDDENMRDMTYEGYTIIYEIRDEVIEIQDIFNKNLSL